MKILAIVGSLRKQSINKKLFEASLLLAPEGMEFELADISSIPLYNEDIQPQPEGVIELKKKIRQADGILIVTPEYNYSIPGVLKNVLDYASRPGDDNSWENKPVAFMGASGRFGTIRAQIHLRYLLAGLDMFVLNDPQILINYRDSFNEEGKIKDPKVEDSIKEFLLEFKSWVEKFLS